MDTLAVTNQAQELFQKAFRSGIAYSYNLSSDSNIINDSELFYSTFQQKVNIWNPNILNNASSDFPEANQVLWGFPIRDEWTKEKRNLTQLCVSSPFGSFGHAIGCSTMQYISLGLVDASSDNLKLAADYGVHREIATKASNVTRTFASYLFNRYRPVCLTHLLVRNDSTLDLQAVAACMRATCRSASGTPKISSDIIGIGVWVAYYTQIGICFIAPILTVLSRDLKKKENTPLSRPESQSSQNKGVLSEKIGLKQKLSGNRLVNLQAAFITSLVDLQKAQCYYMMAIQVASIAMLGSDNKAEGTIAQRQATSNIIRIVAALGIVSPTIILLCLWLLEQRSWYVLVLTSLASTLSIYVFFNGSIMNVPDRFFINPNSDTNDQIYKNTNTDPYSLCSLKLAGRTPPWYGNIATWPIYLCSLILVLIIIDHIYKSRLPYAMDRCFLLPYNEIQHNLERFQAHFQKRRRSTLINLCGRLCRFASVLILTSIFITCFYILGQIITTLYRYKSAEMVDTTWSFGQIVSVAIWVPVVVDWVQLSLRGMESGSEYRIPHPFRVQQVKPPIPEPASTSNFDNTTLEDVNELGLESQAFLGLLRRRTATAEF